MCAGDENITCSVRGCACTLMATRVHEGWVVSIVLVLLRNVCFHSNTLMHTRAHVQSIAQDILCPSPPTCPPGFELETNTVPGQCCPMYNCTELSESSPTHVCMTCVFSLQCMNVLLLVQLHDLGAWELTRKACYSSKRLCTKLLAYGTIQGSKDMHVVIYVQYIVHLVVS